MKKKNIFKWVLLVIIGLILVVFVDGICAKYFDTRPLIAKKEVVAYYIDGEKNTVPLESGIVYKSLFADVYYCDTTVDTYDSEYHMEREQKIIRYYLKKGEVFTCKSSISYYPGDEGIKNYVDMDNPSDMEYIKSIAKDLYNQKLDGLYDVNNKMGVMIYNFLGYPINTRYQDVYMFNINDFSKDPIKLLIEGFDMAWRSINYKSSPSGNIFSFYYTCGYRDQWGGYRKYSEEDCKNNKDTTGIYVFRINSINDYEKINFYKEDNSYLEEYPESYFSIQEVINDTEMIIKYVLTKNKQTEVDKIIYVKWNFITDKSEEIEYE